QDRLLLLRRLFSMLRGESRAGARFPRASAVRGKGALTVAAIVCVLTLHAPAARAGESARTTLTIAGMNCGGCAAGVKIQRKRLEGVMRYDVSYEKGEAQVSYDPAKTTPEKIAESVAAKTGYKVAVKGSKKTTSAGQGSI